MLTSGLSANLNNTVCSLEVKIMPGFNVATTSSTKSRLLCPECKMVLKNPVQTEEGIRLCKSCYDDIAK